jgi:hypothetical protein
MMKLSDLKRELNGYNFELLHGIGPEGGLDGVKRPIIDRFKYCFNNTNLIFDTSIFRIGFQNGIYSNIGLIVADAELLRFSTGDGGRLGSQDVDAITKPIKIDDIKTYLDSYSTGNPPQYCEFCINNVVWGDIFIDKHELVTPGRWKHAYSAANLKDKRVYEIHLDWQLTLVP